MKRIFFLSILCLFLLIFVGCASLSSWIPSWEKSHKQDVIYQPTEGEWENLQKTYQFLKNAGHYYIATVDNGKQPRVRPFGTIHVFENKLYIQTGRRKNVAHQLMQNGRVELCAFQGGEWIRVSGILVDDSRKEAKASLLEEYPDLKKMYSPEDSNTMVLYFRPGSVTATIYSFVNAPVVMQF